MVVDTSALLALLFAEPQSQRIAEILSAATCPMMSAVNYTESLIRVLDRNPGSAQALEQTLTDFALEIVPVDRALAGAAARARLQYPINLGDCFAYALAKANNVALLTLDSDFRKTDAQLVELA